jgi:hypothetical protein
MDGNGALFGTLSGNTREVLHKFTVDLPKKHGKKYYVKAIKIQSYTAYIYEIWTLSCHKIP